MTSSGHYAPMVAEVRRTGGKGIVGGDQAQLTAVEGGGTMGHFARQLGFAQIAEPVRFNAAWERDASLRLRAGDESVLDVYDQHGRIRGGTPEEMMEAAAQSAVNYITAGRDVLLMAQGRDQCRELARRVRDELVRFGVVGDGKTVPLAEGAQASVDDLVILRRNDHARGLANGDVVRVETIEDDGRVRVRKATGRDRDTGQPTFARSQTLKTLDNYDSAYSTTVHSAEGRSVGVGLAYVTGSESREWLTVALTRGAYENTAFTASSSPRAADVKAGVRAAPELARTERLTAEHAGETPVEYEEEPGVTDPLAVLATVLRLQDTQLSATETRDRAAANADHLGLLAPMWDDASKAIRAGRYRQILAETVPAAHQAGLDESPRATWLFRSLRGAEAAGMNARDVVRDAVDARPLDGAADVAAVIDRRIRDQIGEHPTPQPAGTYWSELPDGAPEHVQQLARLQDEREVRLGQHDAVTAPQWALNTLGPVPEDQEERATWEDRAGKIHAYRERYNYAQPDPIGAEPSGNNPEQRARWHRAFGALGPADGPDLRSETTGSLLRKRDTYRYETAWAPRHPGDAVKESRVKVQFAEHAVMRAEAEQRAAEKRGDLEEAARHATAASAWQGKLDTSYRFRAAQLEKAEAAYQDWDHTTRLAREQAVAADRILRQREPDLVTEPLRTAEPPRVTGEEIAELGGDTTPSWLDTLTAQATQVQEEVAERRSIREPGEDPDEDPAGKYAWPAPPVGERERIFHPPEQAMPPAPQVERREEWHATRAEKMARGAEARAELERRIEAGETVGVWDVANAYLTTNSDLKPPVSEPEVKAEPEVKTGPEVRAEAKPEVKAVPSEPVPAPAPETRSEPEPWMPTTRVAPQVWEQTVTQSATETGRAATESVAEPTTEPEAAAAPPEPQPEEIRPVSTDGQWRLDDYARREAEATAEAAAEKNTAAQAKAEGPDLSPYAGRDLEAGRDALPQPPPPEIPQVEREPEAVHGWDHDTETQPEPEAEPELEAGG